MTNKKTSGTKRLSIVNCTVWATTALLRAHPYSSRIRHYSGGARRFPFSTFLPGSEMPPLPPCHAFTIYYLLLLMAVVGAVSRLGMTLSSPSSYKGKRCCSIFCHCYEVISSPVEWVDCYAFGNGRTYVTLRYHHRGS